MRVNALKTRQSIDPSRKVSIIPLGIGLVHRKKINGHHDIPVLVIRRDSDETGRAFDHVAALFSGPGSCYCLPAGAPSW